MAGMRRSPHAAEVFGGLPALLARELDTAPVAEAFAELVAAGWRPGQLRHRIGAEPSQGSVAKDAEHVLALLLSLRSATCPDVLHAQQVQAREEQLRWEQQAAPQPATPEVRDAHLARIRAGLRGLPRRRREPPARTRPGCCLCAGEGSYFVTREVHLCARCVDVLATGRARVTATG